jgi:tetratricopeptide (TPR) repeat protein
VADMTLYRSSAATVVGLVAFAVLVGWSAMRGGRFALAATGLLALGISVHLFLYIRSHLNPAIDEVDPQTWRSLYAHLRREQYPPMNVLARKAPFLWQLKHFGLYFSDQFRMLGDVRVGLFNVGQALTAIPVALGLFGVAANYLRERKVWVLNFLNLLINSLGLIVFLNFSASEVRDRDYFYGGAFYFFAIFIGIGATSILIALGEQAKGGAGKAAARVVPAGLLCILLSILPARHFWFTHDRSQNHIPRDYAYNILAGLEPDAVLFTNGDNDTFPLWYIQCVERYRTDVRVANLSLLNTDWYIKQIRDEDPKIPLDLTDAEIEMMRPIALKGGGVAWKRDLAVQRIIQQVDWKRPVYFATTVPLEIWKPYDRYLMMEGMVRRLVPREGADMMNEFLLERNFDKIFEFRGVLTKEWLVDRSVYKDRDTEGMFINFAVAIAQLGQEKALSGDFKGAERCMERALLLDPTLKAAKILLGTYYMMDNQKEKAIAHYIQMIRQEPGEGEYWLRLARIYEYEDQFTFALQNINEGIRLAPENKQLYIDGFRIAAKMGDAQTAKDFLRQWVERHPDDREMQGVFVGADKLLEEEFGLKATGEKKGGKTGT